MSCKWCNESCPPNRRDGYCSDMCETHGLRAEIERLRAALKPFADEVDMLGIQGHAPPPERMLMFASDGGGTFLGIQVSALYEAHRAYQQVQETSK